MGYKYYQPNKKDKKDDYGDCVVRTLTKALNKEWLDIFDELVVLARDFQCMPNSKPAYEGLLVKYGFTYCSISNAKGTKRPTVKSFAKEHTTGTYVLRVAGHLVCVQDGNYYDTWDSGDKSLYGYYKF